MHDVINVHLGQIKPRLKKKDCSNQRAIFFSY